MTKKQIIHAACELVEQNNNFPSCLAICNGIKDGRNIRGQYEQFLDLDYFDFPGCNYYDLSSLKSIRILMLLLFLECGVWVLAGDEKG